MTKKSITQEYLKECLTYFPDTGIFIWNKRPDHHFYNYYWRDKFKNECEGNIAGRLGELGYWVISINSVIKSAHRWAFLYMTGELPISIDHINHIRSDNRWSNLRIATQSENCRNMPLLSSNSSGFCGVSWSKTKNNWRAYIKIGEKTIHLGYFKSKDNAIAARLSANAHYKFHENHGK